MKSLPPDACPFCGSNAKVHPKLLLIGKESPSKKFPDEIPCGFRRKDQLAVDECRNEVLKEAPLEQFVDGYFCYACNCGFVPDDTVSPELAKGLRRQGFTNNRPPLEVSPNLAGAVHCPYCGLTFKLSDKTRWDGEMHLTCKQRLRVSNGA